jgi:hypothetical protein
MQIIQERSVRVRPMQTKIGSLAIFVAIASSVTSVYASEKSPYDSGYDHGCDDADLDADDRYINEPGKGKAHHTDEFNDGYDEGFSDCGDGDGGDSGDDDSDSGSDGNNNRDDLAQRLCDTVDENRVVAAGIALALGYPGLDVAVSALCEISGN